MPQPVAIRNAASRGTLTARSAAAARTASARTASAGKQLGKSKMANQKGRVALRQSVQQQSPDVARQQRFESLAYAVGGTAVMLGLIVFMVWTRRKRLAELGRRTYTDLSLGPMQGQQQSDTITEEGRLSQLLANLKNPGLIFLFFLVLYHLLPYMTLGLVGPQNTNWLRLIVVVTGIYVVAECLFILVVDYFLVAIQGVEIPRIFYQIIKILAFILVYLPVLSTQFGLDITPLLTTSAVLTMVIGLALQDSLGNLFSGIAMQISNPFKVGDWVLVAGREGRVTEVNWRATTIKTFSNDYLIIPNSNISKAEIQNFSRPTKVHARFLEIGLAYGDSPEAVDEVLVSAALSVNGVLPRPKPQVMLRNYNDFTIDYIIKFFILDYAKYPTIESAIRRRIWYALKRAGMEIPFPIRTIEHKPEVDLEQEQIERVRLLTQVDFLRPISDSGLRELAENFREEIYPTDFDIVNQGEQGHSFYIIRKGKAEVIIPNENAGDSIKVAELEETNFFGEMSLLTGETRNATVRTMNEVETLTLDKDAFRSILHKEPKLAERISEIIVNRKKSTREKLASHGQKLGQKAAKPMSRAAQEREQQNLLKKIILFFGM